MRTISLDARCGSPASTDVSDLRTPSPSQSSLASLAGSSAIVSSTGMGAAGPAICKVVGVGVAGGRCLSPLLIPPRPQPGIDPTVGPASPLGALQPDLYRMPDGPVYLTAPGTSHAVGRLHLRVKYDYHLFDLTVHLIEGKQGRWKGVGSSLSWSLIAAHNLSPIEEGGFRDPYVRLMLQPDVDSRKRQTHIHRGESNPYFDQHFKFPVSRDQLQGKELVLQVLDYDRYSHNDIIGEVRISVDGLDLSKSVEVNMVEHFWTVAVTDLAYPSRSGVTCCAQRNPRRIDRSCFAPWTICPRLSVSQLSSWRPETWIPCRNPMSRWIPLRVKQVSRL